MEWKGQPRTDNGVVTREFFVKCEQRVVPAVLWTPEGPAVPRPVVLMGHGGSQHKTAPGMIDLAGRFVRNHGFAAAAIDGPIQGARRKDGLSGLEVQTEFRAMWEKDHRIDAMVADWRATIDALTGVPDVNPNAIGWYGISMGTAYGLPLAAVDYRIRVALLGMWGTNFVNSQRLADDAPKVRCPVLFQQKWSDQFFTREGQLDLFDRLGSEEKWLKVYLGGHVPVAGEQLADIEDFLSKRLKALVRQPVRAAA
jgi:dienelactone hydrolase